MKIIYVMLLFLFKGELEYGICILNLSDPGLIDDRLSYLLSTAKPQSFILLEDIDAAFVGRDPAIESMFKESFMLN